MFWGGCWYLGMFVDGKGDNKRVMLLGCICFGKHLCNDFLLLRTDKDA